MVSRKNLIILAIFILGAFLRLYRIEENFIFSPEVGHNFLAVKNAFASNQIALVGPPTSHPWLYFGPLFYWSIGPLLWLFKFNPLIGAYFGAVFGIITIILNYLVIKKIFNQTIAIFSSFIIAISPLWIQFSREARFFSLVLPLTYILLISIYIKNFFFIGLSLAVLLNFHYSPLVFFPFIITLVLIKKLKVNKQKIIELFIGLIIPSLPLLIYDSTHKFQMVLNLLIWFPYRLAGFIGFIPKNTVSQETVQGGINNFYKFINLSFLPDGNRLTIILFLIMVIFSVLKFRQIFIWLWLGWGLSALFIHGNPPLHYFLPLFPIPIIIFSYFLAQLWHNIIGKITVLFILLILFTVNLTFYFSSQWFFLPQDRIWPNTDYVPYKIQLNMVNTIIKDAHGKPYNLTRVGPYDYFAGNFAQNYQYLAWWMGNEPVQEKTNLRYTIYETPKKSEGLTIYNQANIKVVKGIQ
ncbi:MAG: glycosyltransferase family 39 protein [Candidatus Gottesmanbacteria bacterium]